MRRKSFTAQPKAPAHCVLGSERAGAFGWAVNDRIPPRVATPVSPSTIAASCWKDSSRFRSCLSSFHSSEGRFCMSRTVALWLILVTCCSVQAQQLKLQEHDHICIVGNGFAERMQHFGWLETLI